MKLFRFIKSKTFWANVVLALVLVALLFWGAKAWMSSYTRHGDNITVPDLSTLAISEVEEELTKLQLSYEIIDSAEFTTQFPRGSVISQYPAPGSLVKINRKIKLTINPLKPRKIELPDLVEKTKRRAIYDLNSKGFKIGEFTYVPYLGKDVVIKASVKGMDAKAGDKLEKGTVIDLTLGAGLDGGSVIAPRLYGLSFAEAKEAIRSGSLNMGSVSYDEEVADTSLAQVYRQYPPATGKAIMGQSVDIWLTDDYTKIPVDTLGSNAIQDSTIPAP